MGLLISTLYSDPHLNVIAGKVELLRAKIKIIMKQHLSQVVLQVLKDTQKWNAKNINHTFTVLARKLLKKHRRITISLYEMPQKLVGSKCI